MTRGHKFRIISGVMIAIIAIALIFVLVDDDTTSVDYSFDQSLPYADTSNWMSYLSDDLYISEITIPGTHDSATENVPFGYAMRCQNTDISQQLQDGYRYLDLRVCVENTDSDSKLKLVHNFVTCHIDGGLTSDYLYLDDVTSYVYDFLDEHPDETVITNFKIEDDNHSVADVQEILFNEIQAHPDYWYTEDRIPTLGEARGRIILMTRFEDEADIGITGIQTIWDEQDDTEVVDIPYELYVTDTCRLWVQDRYKYSVDDKYDAVVDGLENCEADSGTIFLNFVSTSGTGIVGHPKGYAKKLNALLLEYDFQSDTSYGIVIVDFGTEDLARHIYSSNSF